MHRPPRFITTIAALSLAALLAACGGKPAAPAAGPTSPQPGAQPPAAADKPLTKVKYAIATAQFATSVASYTSLPRYLGYWKDEGLDVEVVGLAGSPDAMRLILSKEVQFGTPGSPAYLATAAQTPDVTAFYNFFPHNQYRIAAPEDSKYKTPADLKGAKIGVPDLSSAAVIYTRAVLKQAGLDDQKDVEFLPMGNSAAQMAAGLQKGTIQAIAAYDNNLGGVEATGLKMRRIESAFSAKMGGGQVVAALKDTVKNNRQTAIGIARGIAKATHFAVTNPEAAVRIHWKVYPESKRSGVPEEQALKEALAELNARLSSMRVDDTDKKQWGYVSPQTWGDLEQFLFDTQQIKKITLYKDVFDDSLLAEINNWDRGAVAKQAKEFKAP